jgi:subtilisin family serine protease
MTPRRFWDLAPLLALVLAVVLVLSGCASEPAAPSAAALPEDALSHPENYVVITVRNSAAALTPYAASTGRGYMGLGAYRASAVAVGVAARIAETHHLTQAAAWPIELLGVHCLAYALPPAEPRAAVLAALARDADVESVQPLAQFETQAAPYNDPYAPLQGNLADLGVLAAQETSRGAGVRVAVIDTGIDTAHPDFGGRLDAVRDFVGDGRLPAEAHGTAVAGIIAAVPNNGIGIAGIAPQARVLPLRACWTGSGAVGQCNSFTLAQALAAAVAAEAQIINLSIGGPPDPLLRRIVERAFERGIVVVGAVPLSGRREGFPTGIDGVLAVDVAGRTRPQAGVLYAPGVEVFTLAPQGHYDAVSGSSMATAEVSAIAALLMARRPELKADQLAALLQVGSPAEMGASVNARAALQRLAAKAATP